MTNKINKDYFLHETCLVGKPRNTLTIEIKQKNAQELVDSTPTRNLAAKIPQNANSTTLKGGTSHKLPNQKAALEAIREQLPSAQDQINKKEEQK